MGDDLALLQITSTTACTTPQAGERGAWTLASLAWKGSLDRSFAMYTVSAEEV